MNRTQAIASAQAGAAQIQAALRWFEDNEPSAVVTQIHKLLSKAAELAEPITGVASGTLANPDSGTNK